MRSQGVKITWENERVFFRAVFPQIGDATGEGFPLVTFLNFIGCPLKYAVKEIAEQILIEQRGKYP